MPRKTPPGRVQDVARAACEVFIAKGYRGTRLTDVAERLGLSHALLYRYVESKGALLELAVRYAMDQHADLQVLVPLATPAEGQVVELIRAWLATRAAFPRLRTALECAPEAVPADAAGELGGVIDELYDFIEANRLLLLLLESLIDDGAGISATSVEDRKGALTARLAALLASRASAGLLRPIADARIAAHFLGESVAWFAQHRKRDPNTAAIDDGATRAQVRTLLVAAFVPDQTQRGADR